MRVETRRTVEAVSQEMSALPIDDGYVLKEYCLSRFVGDFFLKDILYVFVSSMFC